MRSFIEVRDFVDQILGGQVPTGLQVVQGPSEFFTDHGRDHLRRVIDRLSELDAFLPEPMNNRECFMILVAAYCHDLGMFLGRREGEDPSETRNDHHNRSAEIVQELVDGHHIDLDRFELPTIQTLVRAHRLINLDNIPLDQWIESDRVRTRLLAALLRIADACDIDHRRAPESVFAYYYNLIQAISRDHWRRHQIVSGVHFDQGRSSIVVSVDLDGGFLEVIGKTRIANAVQRELERELQSVSDVFSRYEVGLVHVEIRDYNRGDYVDFQEFALPDNFVLLEVNSDTQSFESLYDATQSYLSVDSGPFLVIHIAPTEGPLYIDTHYRIRPLNLGDMERVARESLGNDLANFRQSVVPEVVRLS